MTIKTYIDPEDGNAQMENVFENYDQAIDYLAALNRKAIEDAHKEIIPDDEPEAEDPRKEYLNAH